MSEIDATQGDDPLAVLEEEIRSQRDRMASRLLDRVNWLIRNLQGFTAKLEKEGGEARFNSLGEIQAQGPEIDRMTGELAVLQETLSRVQALRERRGARPGPSARLA